VNKDDPRGPAPTNPASDPQFLLWEAPVQAWAKKNHLVSTSTPPTEKDNLHKPENQPTFTIEQPSENQTITDPKLLVTLSGVSAPRGVNRAEYYINNNLLSTISTYPFNLDQPIGFLKSGFQELRVRVCDDIDNCSEKSININLAFPQQPTLEPSISWGTPLLDMVAKKNEAITLTFNVTNPESLSSLSIKLEGASSSAKALKHLQGPDLLPNNTYTWTTPDVTGLYKFTLEGLLWDNKTITSPIVTIAVK
jgi:hypothetical protein